MDAAHHVDRRGLACSVGTEQPENMKATPVRQQALSIACSLTVPWHHPRVRPMQVSKSMYTHPARNRTGTSAPQIANQICSGVHAHPGRNNTPKVQAECSLHAN
jgi:hypothetical protein